MFEKRIVTGSVKENRPKEVFPKNTKFAKDGYIWVVTEEINDTNSVWRRVVSNIGEEELLLLKTLKRDLNCGDIKFVK